MSGSPLADAASVDDQSTQVGRVRNRQAQVLPGRLHVPTHARRTASRPAARSVRRRDLR